MFAVLFEVTPLSGQAGRYFDIAAELRTELQGTAGFVSVERFQSLTRPHVFLSLSYWDSEDAIRAWRNHTCHREGQREGRASVFADYRIRVVSVVRDYSLRGRAEAPPDSRAVFS